MFNVKNLPKVTIILVLIYLSLFIFDKSIFQGKLFEWGCGASPGIYALIACIVFLYLYNPGLLKLNFNEWVCNYTVWYFFLGNFIGIHGFVAHLIGFGAGIVISSILLFRGILK